MSKLVSVQIVVNTRVEVVIQQDLPKKYQQSPHEIGRLPPPKSLLTDGGRFSKAETSWQDAVGMTKM